MSLDPHAEESSHVWAERSQSAATLYARIAPDLDRAVRELHEGAPHLSLDQIRDHALRLSVAALGLQLSRGTLEYLRWRLGQAIAAAEVVRAAAAALRERTAATRAEVRATRAAIADSVTSWPARRCYRDAEYREWCIQEISMADVEWARAPRCLLFSSAECVRRVWSYPVEWWRLSDAELDALSWQS